MQKLVGQGFHGDKIQNLVDNINLKCRKCFVPNENTAMDESIVGFNDQVIWKCYSPNKPTKWGLTVSTIWRFTCSKRMILFTGSFQEALFSFTDLC